MAALAEAHQVTARTLRNWKRLDPAAPPARPGPSPASEQELARTRERVRAVLDEQGWGTGERTISHALAGLPLRRIRAVLPQLKREHCRSVRQVREQHRTSITVHLRDAVWGQDATHLGRDPGGGEVQAEVVREIASTRSIGISVGRPASAEQVIALLERTLVERGTLPLVWVTDNGGQYVADALTEWLAEHQVVHLLNLPRTPQHNPCTEHGHGELKGDSNLGKGVIVEASDARERLQASRDRLDNHRQRESRGWLTAREADLAAQPWHATIDRDAFYAEVACAIEKAVEQCSSWRARRRAEREAILHALETHGAITRTRGGAPITQSNAEDDS